MIINYELGITVTRAYLPQIALLKIFASFA